MLPYLNFFGMALPVPQLLILLGIYLALGQIERHTPTFKESADDLYNLTFITLIAGLLGARASFAMLHPSAFAGNLLNLFSLNPGLLDAWGGLLVGLVAGIVYGQRKQLKSWTTLDALTPGFLVFLLFVPLANLASGDGYGASAQLPWSIQLWGSQRHPVQLYEFFGGLMILIYLFPGRRIYSQDGLYFSSFLIISSAARLIFEGFHGDSTTAIWQFRDIQLISFGVLALALWLYARQQRPANG
jgi:phosphatidylglycerol:prolipoprotein diacylglycerol transferase